MERDVLKRIMEVRPIFCVLSALCGIALPIIGCKRSIVIKYSYSWVDWIFPIGISLVVFSLMQLGELGFSYSLISSVDSSNAFISLLVMAIKNGLLLPLIVIVLSSVFGIAVKNHYLDYSKHYGKLVSQVCLSDIIIVSCVVIICVLKTQNATLNEFEEYAYDRLFMWILTAAGTWVGFSIGCKGRIEKENELREKINKPNLINEPFTFWLPIIFILIVFDILPFFFMFKTNIMLEISEVFFEAALILLFFGLVTYGVIRRSRSEEKSISILYKAIREKKKHAYYFRRNKYHVKDNTIIIDAINVKFPGHPEENEIIQDLFGEKSIDCVDVDKCKDDLIKRSQKQEDYLNNKNKLCLDEKREEGLVKLDDKSDGKLND